MRRKRVWGIPIIILSMSHFVHVSSQSGFPSAYVVVICLFNDLCRDVAICFVDIGGMADHTV